MPPFEFLGPYRIGETLGRGGMGSVYSAVHEKTKEPVAVKLISANVADEPRFRRRFNAEIRTLQRLRHEGIVRLIGHGEEDGQLFYSMELVEGESLQSRLKREKRLDWRLTLDLAIEICAALKHAHDFGIIHRDLKPANLLLTKSCQIKLVDFGIAKIFGSQEQTMVGSVLGTADFMAPEQATSSGITVRTDLYSVGSLLYVMLTGRPPFRGKNTNAVIESLLRDQPIPLDIINPELPDELVTLVHHLLEKDQADRPPTALAVMNRLKAMRLGLQKSATVLLEDSPTQLGAETSVEHASSDQHPTSAENHPEKLADRPTDEKPSVDIQTACEASPNEAGSRPPEKRQTSSFPTRATAFPETFGNGTIASEANEREGIENKNHFQAVSHTLETTGHGDDHQDNENPWSRWGGIGLMLVVLLAGATMFALAMRPPTADQLYATATVDGDNGAQRVFLKRFPDDPRADEIRDLLMAEMGRGIVNRLSAQASLGVKPLMAAEEGFLEAMRNRNQSPKESSKRLQAWLNAFDNALNREREELAALIEVARFEQQRLARLDSLGQLDSRVRELLDQIEVAKGLEDHEEKIRQLQGIIDTFEKENWAQPAVKRAREAL